jgi:hypothetical protein
VTLEQRPLQRDRHRLHDAARRSFVRAGERTLHHGAVALLQLGEEPLRGLRRTVQRAQHVQALHVRAALPDRVQRALAEEARELPEVLDVAVAA